jgi:hypothetical protein
MSKPKHFLDLNTSQNDACEICG